MQRIVQFTLLNILLICGMSPISATENTPPLHGIPFTNSYYYHFARDQHLDALVKDFCSMQGINVVISPLVVDVVNGRFNKMNPAEFWDYITQAYGLSWFYDGKILFVYKNSELQTQIFRMDADGILTMSNIIRHLGFSSSDFSFRSVPNANILIVTAPPKYLETINDLTVKFVSEKITDTTIVKTFPLKYAWAYDMSFTYKDGSITVPGVATLLQNIVTGTQSGYTMSNMNIDLGGKTQTKHEKMQNLAPVKAPVKNAESASTSKKDDSKSQNPSDDNENATSTGALPGFITCDQRLNAVIIRDKHQNMQFYEDIIKQLDVPCDVIKIDVAIVDVSQSEGLDFGLSAAGVKKGENRIFNAGVSGENAKKQGKDLQGAANVFAQMNGVLRKYTISAYLQALEDHGHAKTVAKPSVLTLDNVGAIIEKEQTMYSKVTSRNDAGLYDISATTKLQVVPHVIPGDTDENGKKKMKMFVNVQDGALSGKDQQDATPTCDSNSINTQAVLYEGQSLLIGGYFREEKSKTASGVPFLQRIPLIGSAFRHTVNSSNIVERIYVISPSIVDIDEQERKYDHFTIGGSLETKGTVSEPVKAPPKKISLTKKASSGLKKLRRSGH